LSDISGILGTTIKVNVRPTEQDTGVYLDIDSSNGYGLTLTLAPSGVSAWRRKNGTQTNLFNNH